MTTALAWPVVSAVLGGAMLHAAWNALIKAGDDKAADTALVAMLAALLALPFAGLLGAPPPSAWPWLAASAAIHTGYYTALAGAYRHGELGLTYPIMRGVAPLFVALASGALFGEAPSGVAWAGIAAITVGVGLVGLARPAAVLQHAKALAFAFTNAGLIAAYTLVDARGVRATSTAGSAGGVGGGGTEGIGAAGSLRYVLLLFVFNGFAYPALVWARRGAAGRAALRRHIARRWRQAALGGAASIGAYAIALWAMTRAPVASVAAMRETSVLFAALLGSRLLNERFGLRRVLGTGVIVAGVMALRMA